MDINLKKKIYKDSLIILICCILAEVSLFNFRHWLTIGYEPTDITSYFSAKRNMEEISFEEASKLSVTELENDGTRFFKVSGSASSVYLEALGINKHINNIYADVFNIRTTEKKPSDDSYDSVAFNVKYNSLGYDEYTDGGKVIIAEGVERSKYITFATNGISNKLVLELSQSLGDVNKSDHKLKDMVIGVRNISINKPVPLDFNLIRLGIVFVAAWLIYFIFVNKTSEILEYELNRKSKNQAAVTLILGMFLIVFTSNYIMGIKDTRADDYINTIYYKLSDSILKGQVSELTEPQYWLSRMQNVYDTSLRDKYVNSQAGSFGDADNSPAEQIYNGGYEWGYRHFGADNAQKASYYFDNAYYNGNYYVYYGVAPLILIFPFRLITGLDLNLKIQHVIVTAFLCYSCFRLMRLVMEKMCRQVSYLGYIFAASLLYVCNSCVLARSASIYHLLFNYALIFAFMGISFFLSCYDEEKKKLSCPKIFAAALFISLIVTARPHVVLCVFAVFPLLWQLTFKERALFSKKGIGATLCLILPVVAVAAAQMYYNYIRFENPLEFGATVQLTVNDCVHRRTSLRMYLYLLYLVLFSLNETSLTFPFFTSQMPINNKNLGVGKVDMGQLHYGGIFNLYVVPWLMFFVFAVKKQLKENRAWGFVWGCIISGVAIMSINLLKIGLWNRYICDFTFLFVMAGIIIGEALVQKWKGTVIEYKVRKVFAAMLILGAVISLLVYFAPTNEYNLMNGGSMDLDEIHLVNPNFYYKVFYAVMFFL